MDMLDTVRIDDNRDSIEMVLNDVHQETKKQNQEIRSLEELDSMLVNLIQTTEKYNKVKETVRMHMRMLDQSL